MTHRLPQGFQVGGVHCGLKQHSDNEDLTLIVCDSNAVAVGVYTQNLVYAAPVELDRQRTPMDNFRVVVVNAGNANACTGSRGYEDALEMARLAAQACDADPDQALVMSTGVIGEYLAMDKLVSGIARAKEELGTDESCVLAAARGMTTTDNGPKLASRGLTSGIQITGLAKGAAMIGPRMATMLCALMTDARLTMADAQSALRDAVDASFNCISVEGHTSTNDTVLLLASGHANSEPISGDVLDEFRGQLTDLCIELAKMIPADGEGSTHLIEIEIEGCGDAAGAHRIAETVAASALVKTAVTGGDPNWGRIVSAAGYAGVPFNPARVSLSINGFEIYLHGAPSAFDAAAVSASMKERRQTNLRLTFEEGDASARFWTSDLTVDYVKFNADYHT